MEAKVSRKMSYIRNQVKQTSTDLEERRSSNWRRKQLAPKRVRFRSFDLYHTLFYAALETRKVRRLP
jgi:hypothetical protein